MNGNSLRPNFVMGGYLPRTWDEKNFSEPPHLDEDERWMMRALIVSMNAVGWSSPNPAVGCVMVKDGAEIASGFTQSYRHEHAEKMAFLALEKSAGSKENFETLLKGSTVYVTLEPCSHVGHQPPCVDLILNSPVKRVVMALNDPDDRVAGRSIERLIQAGKEVTVGVLEDECRAWHLPFLKSRIDQKVLWVAKWAQTKNGMLADGQGDSKWITCPKSRSYTHWLRQKYDAILVGAGTWIKDQPALTVRDCAGPHRRNPIRLVFDPNGRLLSLPVEQILIHHESPVRIFVRDSILESARVKHLLPKGSHPLELVWTSLRGEDPVQDLIDEVGKLPIQSVMVEGGPTLLNLLFEKDVFGVCHQFQGIKEFVVASSQYQLKEFKNNRFQRIVDQKIDDDRLQEWLK